MKKLFLLLFIGCVCTAMTVVYAQELTKGMIIGKALDDKGDPLPGVTVTAVSERGVSKSTVSEADGTFRLPFLVPGTYSIKLEMENFKTYEKAEITVPLNARIDVGTVTMQLGGKGEVITVTGNPVVDLSSASAGTNITETLMKSVPIGRTFASTIFLAPGVSGSGVPGGINPSISGSSGLENTYIIDGVNITNTGYGSLGTFNGALIGLTSGMNVDYVKEVQIKAGGVEAEYGQALGGVINVITKSGGNLFDGEAFAYIQPGAMEGRRTLVHTVKGTVNTVEYQTLDAGIGAGGKIIKDKLFWFAVFDPQENKTTMQAPDNVDENGNYVFPFRTLLPDGKDSVSRRIFNYAGKLTWNITNDNIIEFSAFGDPGRSKRGLQSSGYFLKENLETAKEALETGGNSQSLRWVSVLNPKWFVEAQIANHTDVFKEKDYVNIETIYDYRSYPYRYIGGIGSVWPEEGSNIQYSIKFTNIFKNHELKYGIAFEDISFAQSLIYLGEPRCFNYYQTETGDLKQACTTSGAFLRIRRRFLSDDTPYDRYYASGMTSDITVRTKTSYLNWFLQDSWNITPHITLKAGIRWERQCMEGGGEGHGDITLSGNWAPRIGISWDFMKDGKSKLYGFWGRYFEKVPNDAAKRSLSVEKTIYVVADTFNLDIPYSEWYSIYEDINNVAYATEYGYEPTVWEEGLKSQYQDEFVAGVEREIMPGLNLSGRFIYRTIGRIIEDIQLTRYSDIFCGTDQTDPNCTPADFGNFVVANMSSRYQGMPDPKRIYKAFELVASKRISDNWQMMASWRIARLKGNYEGLYNNDNGQADPNITSKFDFPYLNDREFWGPTGDIGVLPMDRTHIVRLFGSYTFKNGINVGLGIDAESGTPISKLGCVELYGCFERLLQPRGSLGRTDWLFTLDTHIDYTFTLFNNQQFTALLDIFNLLGTQTPTKVNMASEDAVSVPSLTFLSPRAYQSPRQIRFGIRYSF